MEGCPLASPAPFPLPAWRSSVLRCPADWEGQAACLQFLKSAGAPGVPRGTSSLRKADDISIKATSPPAAPEESHSNAPFPLFGRQGESRPCLFGIPKRQQPPLCGRGSFDASQSTSLSRTNTLRIPGTLPSPSSPSPFSVRPTFPAFSVEGSSSWQTSPRWRLSPFQPYRPPPSLASQKRRGSV